MKKLLISAGLILAMALPMEISRAGQFHSTQADVIYEEITKLYDFIEDNDEIVINPDDPDNKKTFSAVEENCTKDSKATMMVGLRIDAMKDTHFVDTIARTFANTCLRQDIDKLDNILDQFTEKAPDSFAACKNDENYTRSDYVVDRIKNIYGAVSCLQKFGDQKCEKKCKADDATCKSADADPKCDSIKDAINQDTDCSGNKFEIVGLETAQDFVSEKYTDAGCDDAGFTGMFSKLTTTARDLWDKVKNLIKLETSTNAIKEEYGDSQKNAYKIEDRAKKNANEWFRKNNPLRGYDSSMLKLGMNWGWTGTADKIDDKNKLEENTKGTVEDKPVAVEGDRKDVLANIAANKESAEASEKMVIDMLSSTEIKTIMNSDYISGIYNTLESFSMSVERATSIQEAPASKPDIEYKDPEQTSQKNEKGEEVKKPLEGLKEKTAAYKAFLDKQCANKGG